jgi:hypothetical protein
LLIITCLFNSYLNKKHYYVTRYLPTEDCGKIDRKNETDGMTLDFLKEGYLQPAMKTKSRLPGNYSEVSGKFDTIEQEDSLVRRQSSEEVDV